jgi:hypothetical protein
MRSTMLEPWMGASVSTCTYAYLFMHRGPYYYPYVLHASFLQLPLLQVLSWFGSSIRWSQSRKAKVHSVRDPYESAVKQALKDPLLNHGTGIRRKAYLPLLFHCRLNNLSFIRHQIYRTILAHLTTTIVEITAHLAKSKMPQDNITHLSVFDSLLPDSQDKSSRNPGKRDRGRTVKDKVARPHDKSEAEGFLAAVQLSSDAFIETHSIILKEMRYSIDHGTRLSKSLPFRLLAMSGLMWATNSKATQRDWGRVASAITIESALVESYRPKLLKECFAARLLRIELHDFFVKVAPKWKRYQTRGEAPDIKGQSWIFPDNIYINDAQDLQPPPAVNHVDLRAQVGAEVKKKPLRKNTRKKDPVIAGGDNGTNAEKINAPTVKVTAPAQKDEDGDIQPLLKSIQGHKLLQCSDSSAPSGSTESIVAFAASIIGHVSHYFSLFCNAYHPFSLRSLI